MATADKNGIEKAEYGGVAPGPSTRSYAAPRRRLGNPGPLGLYSFASTTLILSLFNAQARGITHPNAVVGMALGVGGLAQLLAGMWEFAVGNTFGATAFSSYGGFWLSYGSIFLPNSGILAAYDSADELASALAIYLTTWGIVTFLLLIGATRRNAGLIALFFFLMITFFLLAGGEYTGHVAVSKAGGYFGIITALIAYYVGTAELLIREESWFTMPLGQMPKRLD